MQSNEEELLLGLCDRLQDKKIRTQALFQVGRLYS